MDSRYFLVVLLSLAIVSPTLSYQISATTSKIVYTKTENLSVYGTLGIANESIDIGIYSFDGTLLNSSSKVTSASGEFSFECSLASYSEGNYYVLLRSGSDSLRLDFRVVGERAFVLPFFIKSSSEIYNVTLNEGLPSGGNFSDLLALNNTGINFGSKKINEKEYYFVTLDQERQGFFDTLYVDDDKNFSLYDDGEDGSSELEQQYLKPGDTVKLNNTKYQILEIGNRGKTLLLARTIEKSTFSPKENITLLVVLVSEDENRTLLGNRQVSLQIYKSTNLILNQTELTNSDGYAIFSFSAPSETGEYSIKINGGMDYMIFTVESFKFSGYVSNPSGTPMHDFAPKTKVRINAVAKDLNDNSLVLKECYAVVTKPDGTKVRINLTKDQSGIYYGIFVDTKKEGVYGVKLVGNYNGQEQEFLTGFEIVTSTLQVVAFNPEFMDRAGKEGPGFEVNSFAPNSNVTIMVMLFGPGGFEGPAGPNVIPIDDPATSDDECRKMLSLIELKDRYGNSYLSTVDYEFMNVSNTMNFFNVSEEEIGDIPKQMFTQCTLKINNLSKVGVYRVKIRHEGLKKVAGDNFGIQNILASGHPVGDSGEEYWFNAPNTSISIKLEITDLKTRELLPISNILEAKVVGIQKEFPEFKDMFEDVDYRNRVNDSFDNTTGILKFLAPSEEGFYTLKFRFKANYYGNIEEGTGKAHFMLKKYFIWAEPHPESGKWYFSSKENITLKVHIIDADLASSYGSESCSGCVGLVATVEHLRNDQLMKEIDIQDPNQTLIIPGAVVNSTSGATIKIIPKEELPPGWYGVDIKVENPDNPSEKYFGWGGFEIRNFFIDVIPATYKDGNLTASREFYQFPVGEPVILAIIGRMPPSWEPIDLKEVKLESLLNFGSWPPSEVNATVNISQKTVWMWNDKEGKYEPIDNVWVLNITGITEEGEYQANIKGVYNKTEDIGAAWFSVSSYLLKMYYEGMDTWPHIFPSDKNLTINFTACKFSGDYGKSCIPHNLSKVEIENLFSEKKREPIKTIFGKHYNYSCSLNNCTLLIYLPELNLSQGRYFLDIKVYDEKNVSKREHIDFEIRSFILEIPQIYESWLWGDTQTNQKELWLNNREDMCSSSFDLHRNERSKIKTGIEYLARYEYLEDDSCPESSNTTLCIWNSTWNFTLPFNKSEYSTTGIVRCVYSNGTWGLPNNTGYCENSTYVYIVSNGSALWIKINSSKENPVDMTTNTSTLGEGDTFNASGIQWVVYRIGKFYNWSSGQWEPNYRAYVILAKNFIDAENLQNKFNCSQPISVRLNVNSTYPDNYAGVYCILNKEYSGLPKYCNGTSPEGKYTGMPLDWVEGECPNSSVGITVYVYSNGSMLWINTSPDLFGSGIKKGEIFNVEDRKWMLIDINTSDRSFSVFPLSILVCSTELIPKDMPSSEIENAFGGAVCLVEDGIRWELANCDGKNFTCWDGSQPIFMASNGTALFLNLTGGTYLDKVVPVHGTFSYQSKSWNVTGIFDFGDGVNVKLKRNEGICGEYWEEGSRYIFVLKVPSNDSTFYFGKTYLLPDPWPGSYPVYIYHNGSMLWMGNTTDLTSAPHNTTGGMIQDPYGGIWKILSLSQEQVKLEGINVLSDHTLINTSLSKSGIFKFGAIFEEELGDFDPETGTWKGMDLNGNGKANDTLYYAIVDTKEPGIYDAIMFSEKREDFSNASLYYTYENRTNRQVFKNLTLLNIDPRANRVFFYTNKKGWWAELGDYKYGDNVSVPVLVMSPSGTPIKANVSISVVRDDETGARYSINMPPIECNGICEIPINIEKYNLTTGRYAFGIKAEKDGKEVVMEDWKWPRATLRLFLIDTRSGYVTRISGFKPIRFGRYDGETYGEIPELKEDRRCNLNLSGVLLTAHQINKAECNITGDNPNLIALREDDSWPSVYFLYNISSEKLYMNVSGCSFNLSDSNIDFYKKGDSITIPAFGKNYTVNVSEIYNCSGEWFVDFGLLGVNKSIIKPILPGEEYDEWGARWRYLQGVNISGTLYNVILASGIGDENISYPMCEVWGVTECVKVAFFDQDTNFSDAVGVKVGEGIDSTSYYLASIGPGPWEGITIANASTITPYPNVSVRIWFADGTEAYYTVVNESSQELDLNKTTKKTYYILLYDDLPDGEQNVTKIVVDDDVNITPEFSSWEGGNETYYDFYGNESGLREYDGGVPSAIWDGWIRFGEESWENWERNPSWNVLFYNSTEMLLLKDVYCINQNDTFGIIVKVYNFNQTAKVGVNVSIEKITTFTFFGPQTLNQSEYIVLPENGTKTNSEGYAMIRIKPIQSWEPGEYMVTGRVEEGGNVERFYEHFDVGCK